MRSDGDNMFRGLVYSESHKAGPASGPSEQVMGREQGGCSKFLPIVDMKLVEISRKLRSRIASQRFEWSISELGVNSSE